MRRPQDRSSLSLLGNPNADTAVIAIMGATGAGKSHFVRSVTGKAFKPYSTVVVASNIKIGTKNVVLLDTPTFEDPDRPEAEVFLHVTKWMAELHRSNARLSGILYLHPISTSTPARNIARTFLLFRKLCGLRCMDRVLFATSHWDMISEKDRLAAETRELQVKDDYWGVLLESGATVGRFDGTRKSGLGLLQTLISKTVGRSEPLALRIQRELIDLRRPILETDAGSFVISLLRSTQKKLEEDLKKVSVELEAAKAHEMFDDVNRSRRTSREQRHLQEQVVNQAHMRLLRIKLDMRTTLSGLELLGARELPVQAPTPIASPRVEGLKRLSGLRRVSSAISLAVKQSLPSLRPQGSQIGLVRKRVQIQAA